MTRSNKHLPTAFLALYLANAASAQWVTFDTPATTRLRGLAAVDSNVIWATGAKAAVLLTTDGGKSWHSRDIPGADNLDLRDIHAFDDKRAIALASGEGAKSRIYSTADAGRSWSLRYQVAHPNGFLDAIEFWDASNGIALGDPIDQRFFILITADSGASWQPLPPGTLPNALPGEAAFAASGSCLAVQGKNNVWFATGGAQKARVFRSSDRGASWSAHDTPIHAGSASAGIFSIAFVDAKLGAAVGGDFRNPERAVSTIATTRDGGQTWNATTGATARGYRSSVAFVANSPNPSLIAVGPTGADFSTNLGADWQPLQAPGFDTVRTQGPNVIWVSGENGRVARWIGPFPPNQP
jgi:photosystem II stability/assembly factor-like uncharacterized protein